MELEIHFIFEGEKALSCANLLPECLQWPRWGQDQSLGPGTQSKSSICVVGTQLLELLQLAPRVHTGRKLGSKVETKLWDPV